MKQSRSTRNLSCGVPLFVAVVAVLAFGACEVEQPAAPADEPPELQASIESPRVTEGEFIGNVYLDGVRDTSSGLTFTLTPIGDTEYLIKPPFSETLVLSTDRNYMIEYFFPGAGDGPCAAGEGEAGRVGLQHYMAGDSSYRGDEVHGGTGVESHCIMPGKYEVGLEKNGELIRTFEIDYFRAQVNITNDDTGYPEGVEELDFDPGRLHNLYKDLRLDIDRTGAGGRETPVLRIQNKHSNPYSSSSFSDESSPSGSTADYFRLSVAGTDDGWETDDSEGLARLFWNKHSQPLRKTGFFCVPKNGGASSNTSIMRVHQFLDDVEETGIDTVGMELMRPDEEPGTGTEEITKSRTINFTSIPAQPPDAGFSAYTHTWRLTDQYLDASDSSSTGPDFRYKWRFEASGAWTSYSSDPVYEFMGHATANHNTTVSLRVKNVATGDSAQADRTFDVESQSNYVSGPDYVTDKKVKTYTAGYVSDWYTRFHPESNPDWTFALNNATVYHRIWAAGDYFVALRAQQEAVGGVLGRGRKNIEVCAHDCDPIERAEPGADERVAGMLGLGPWIAAQNDPENGIVRFYDLTGLHEQESPFVSPDWLAGPAGKTTDADHRWELTWIPRDVAVDGTYVFDFEVTPSGGSGPFTFGMAADPDLGNDPTDDRSSYDADRGLVYVFDGGSAVGFLLLSGGENALITIQQFGVEPQAPRTDSEAWSVLQAGSSRLESAEGDVQLILGTEPSASAEDWTFVVIEAGDVDELRSRTDAVLSALRK